MFGVDDDQVPQGRPTGVTTAEAFLEANWEQLVMPWEDMAIPQD